MTSREASTAHAHEGLPRPRLGAILPPTTGGRAETRAVRIMALGFLPASAVFGLLVAMPVAAQWDDYPAWWTIGALVGMLLSAALFGALAFSAPMRVLRALATTSGATALVAAATLPLVAHQMDPAAPWLQQIHSIGAVAVAAVWRPLTATVVTVALALLTAVDRLAVGAAGLTALQDGLYVLLFCFTFVALATSVRASSRALDSAESAALREATASAGDVARERERSRVNALVHDRVLAALLSAARSDGATSDLERADARRALDDLHELLGPETPKEAAGGHAFVWGMQATTTEFAPEAVFGYEVRDAPRRIPAEAVEALTAALEEALRNSMRHAGDDANRTVHVEVSRDGVRIDVLDDGRGFDESQVPASRLGIAESIRGRLRAVDGCSAKIVSEIGVGTRLVLCYEYPELRG